MDRGIGIVQIDSTNNKFQYFIDGVVVSEITATRFTDFINLNGFHTVEKYRGKGYGALLLKSVVEHYKKSKHIELGVEYGNSVAKGMYEKIGFEVSNSFEENGVWFYRMVKYRRM